MVWSVGGIAESGARKKSARVLEGGWHRVNDWKKTISEQNQRVIK
jgi:hypothetical protein